MNRTLLPESSSQVIPSPDPANWFARQEFGSTMQQPAMSLVHSLFAPINYESGYAYPLIVWLHGPCSNEDELPEVMPLISTRNHVAIAPRGTRKVEGVYGAYGWDDSADGIVEAGQRVDDCIAIAQERFNINPDRIFVAGYSAGGTMAHRLGLEYPERFAGAISLGGRVPRGSHLLKNLKRARQLPLLLSVSPTEENYPSERVMEDLRFLHSAGMSLSLRIYPEGDDLTTVMFKDLNAWVMEQFCPTDVVAAS